MPRSKTRAERVQDTFAKCMDVAMQVGLRPVLHGHDKVYGGLNTFFRGLLDANKARVPAWFDADFVTWTRTTFLFPCLYLWAQGHTVIPALLVILVDLGDFLDGVLWRWWRDQGAYPAPPTVAEDVASGVPQIASARTRRLRRQWGQWFDAEADKAFIVPVWIFALAVATPHSFLVTLLVWLLIITETASALIRARRYYSDPSASAATTAAALNDSGVKSDEVGKAKQTFEMVGTALLIMPWSHYLGAALLLVALPLALESVRRKIQRCVIYTVIPEGQLQLETLVFLQRARSLGSELVVGVQAQEGDTASPRAVAVIAQLAVVDWVAADIPDIISAEWMDTRGYDYCATDSEILGLPGSPTGVAIAEDARACLVHL